MTFRADLLDPKKITAVRDIYQNNLPFPHVVVQDAIQDEFLRQVRSEVISNLQFKFEENDVYRVRRSTHLANISNPNERVPELLPNLTRLRDALYSLQFREWLSSVTGVGPLSGTRSSMAVNLYMPGDHLLVHDDCNPKSKNRRVSFILYLTDPDSQWRSEWGGTLRLYANTSIKSANGNLIKVTNSMWSKSVLPCFNQLTFFAIRPGETYHEVEEVLYSGDKMVDQERRRMAISGWFHAAEEGEEGFNKELYRADMQRVEHFHQLKATAYEFYEPRTVFMPFQDVQMDCQYTNATLTSQEAEYLSQYLAPQLLARAQIAQISRCFIETLAIQLDRFLCEQFEAKIKDFIIAFDHSHVTTDQSERILWKAAKPPGMHRYMYLESSTASSTQETPISQLLSCLLWSHPFRKWLVLVTGLELSSLTSQHVIARRFRRGLDYILTDPHSQRELHLDYTLEITPTSRYHDATCKASGDGGEEVYEAASHTTVESMFAGESGPQARAKACGCKNLSSGNRFSAMMRYDGMQSLVKYVSQAVSGDRWDIKGKVQLNGDVRYKRARQGD